MRAEDLISIVSFEGKAVLQLKKTGVLDRKKWEKAIDNLKSSGGTHFADGIDFAYTYMKENLEKGYNNRILLVSDGEFEVSDNIKQMVENAAKDNQIVFSALIYNPKAEVYPKIQYLAKRSGGNYSLISSKSDGVPMLYLEFAILK
jgi:Ca-activated chloride channel homolog